MDPEESLSKPPSCGKCDSGSVWVETTAYELVERKPDYQKMIENKQFGKFWDVSEIDPITGILGSYKEGNNYPFVQTDGACGWAHFTPCTEPVELDPITLEPIK